MPTDGKLFGILSVNLGAPVLCRWVESRYWRPSAFSLSASNS